MAEVEPRFTEFFRLMPWDLDRLTLRQFNAYMEYHNKSAAAAEAASKGRG